MSSLNLSSYEYNQLFALRVERSMLKQTILSDNEYKVVAAWLNQRIEHFETKGNMS